MKGKILMKKIIVIGCPGSGKSTFSRALHQETGLPLVHLDMLYWNPDGTTVPKKTVFLERLHEAMSGESWIIDGNYGSTMELRIATCDTVIFLDYPTELCLEGIKARKGKPRPDMPWQGATENEDEEFITFIKNYASQSRPAVLELLEKYHNKNIVIFRDRQDSDAFLWQIQNK